MLNGFSGPMIGFFKKGDPNFGDPKNIYTFDPGKAKALLAKAGPSRSAACSGQGSATPSG